MDMVDPIYDLLASHLRLAGQWKKLSAEIVAVNAEPEKPQAALSEPVINAALNLIGGTATVIERDTLETYLADDRFARAKFHLEALQASLQATQTEMQAVEFQIYSTTPATPGGIWAMLNFLKSQIQITGGSVPGCLAAIDSVLVGLSISGAVDPATQDHVVLH